MLDLTQEMMTKNGVPVVYRPDYLVFEGEGGAVMVVDREGYTTKAKVQKIVPRCPPDEAAELVKAAQARQAAYSRAPEAMAEREAARLMRQKQFADKERIRAAKERDRVKALKQVLGRIPVGHELGMGQAASQIAKRTGEKALAVFWWLIRVSRKEPDHPARAYMLCAGTDYVSLFNPGGAKTDNGA
jgi:hypothetical protein